MKFNVNCLIIACLDLPCNSVAEARDYLRNNSVDVLKDAESVTNATLEGGIDLEDIEVAE